MSNTNVSGPKHTCQSCAITASGSTPCLFSGSETANQSVHCPELALSGHKDTTCGSNSGVKTASFSGANTASLTPSLSGPKPTRFSNPSFADAVDIGAEVERDEDDTWLQRIDLRVVECSEEGIGLSTPPFPFYQHWDPQYPKKKKNRKMARASDAEYEQWTADGKPFCPTYEKRPPPSLQRSFPTQETGRRAGRGLNEQGVNAL